MGIDHLSFYICMSQDILQYQYIAALYHKVAGESVTQNMSELLAGLHFHFCFVDIPKGLVTISEQPFSFFITHVFNQAL